MHLLITGLIGSLTLLVMAGDRCALTDKSLFREILFCALLAKFFEKTALRSSFFSEHLFFFWCRDSRGSCGPAPDRAARLGGALLPKTVGKFSSGVMSLIMTL